MQKLINEVGNKYGFLTVIERTRDKNNKTTWLCKCECGNFATFRGSDLRNKKIVSCGCKKKKYIDESNNKYGLLTVIKRVGVNSSGVLWECLCECGNLIVTNGRSLRNGDTKSCGCIKSQGEYLISKYLNFKNINFKKEYSFDDLINIKTNNKLRFDFAVFIKEKIILIEFDGIQHFRNNNWSHISLEEIKKRDEMKDNYCKEKNIPLIRISYKEIEKIEKILEENLNNIYGNGNTSH